MSRYAGGRRCGSSLVLAGKRDRCRLMLGHFLADGSRHRWWSEDGRVQVTWTDDAGGRRWRRPKKAHSDVQEETE